MKSKPNNNHIARAIITGVFVGIAIWIMIASVLAGVTFKERIGLNTSERLAPYFSCLVAFVSVIASCSITGKGIAGIISPAVIVIFHAACCILLWDSAFKGVLGYLLSTALGIALALITSTYKGKAGIKHKRYR